MSESRHSVNTSSLADEFLGGTSNKKSSQYMGQSPSDNISDSEISGSSFNKFSYLK
jgi:hypothetical protein